MKFLVIFSIFINFIATFPVDYDQIVFPDDNRLDRMSGKLNLDKRTQLDDPNLLKSENTIEDTEEDSKFEHGNHFQGDIVLLEDQKKFLNNTDLVGTRTGLIWEKYRWPKNRNGRVVVPYKMSNVFSYKDKLRIVSAMNDLQLYTCVQFTARTYETDYINIISGDGCFSNIGRVGGMQYVSLQRRGCLSHGTILHELIHTLGYDHMQNHPERDSYVYILWNNIVERQRSNFKKDDYRQFSNFGTPYDYYSVMHYEPYAFSKNGKPTIMSLDSNYSRIIGQRKSLSAGDAKRIIKMYKC
ncbi:hatching enzyme 1.2-like [Chironomus tepperi]|uniref:hatching enzyme 1.2-like n=1 Tax=Chironomus tepperi TaxID=113505 RepID=UPI00391F5C26